MPRRSAEARATAAVAATNRLKPSPHLTPAERKVWQAIVDCAPAGHLHERDRVVLESLVSLAVINRKLAEAVGKMTAEQLVESDIPKRIDAHAKTIGSLHLRLKLGPLAGVENADKAGQREESAVVPPLLGGVHRLKAV
jgi:hypothetical protein